MCCARALSRHIKLSSRDDGSKMQYKGTTKMRLEWVEAVIMSGAHVMMALAYLAAAIINTRQ
jgi:hypothetical protein